MKAVFYNQYGPPEVLEVGELDIPKINEEEVLIRVHAAAVNPVDWKVRSGSIRILTGSKFPKGLGGDIAGEIVKVGQQVAGFEVGDEVYGKLNGFKSNAYAEYVAASPVDIARKPTNLNYIESASVPLAALTAYQGLVTHGKLAKDSKVLVNGSSGGVGHFGVQIVKAMGAAVTGVCSSKNIEFTKKIGADQVIDYTKNTVFNNDERYDIFFDAVANQSFGRVKPILKKNGRYVTTLPAVGVIFNMVFGRFSSKKARMSNVKSHPIDLQQITDWIEKDQVKPMVEKVYTIEDVQEAHRRSETGRVVGKLVLAIG